MVIGRVTEAKARSRGDQQSSLGIMFEKIRLRDGKEVAIKGILRAVGPDPAPEPVANYKPDRVSSNPGTPSSLENLNRPLPDMQPRPVTLLNEESVGVLNVPGLQLGANGVLSSTGKEVRLQPEMQVTLQITIVH